MEDSNDSLMQTESQSYLDKEILDFWGEEDNSNHPPATPIEVDFPAKS